MVKEAAAKKNDSSGSSSHSGNEGNTHSGGSGSSSGGGTGEGGGSGSSSGGGTGEGVGETPPTTGSETPPTTGSETPPTTGSETPPTTGSETPPTSTVPPTEGLAAPTETPPPPTEGLAAPTETPPPPTSTPPPPTSTPPPPTSTPPPNPPNLNDISLRTFVSNGAAVGGVRINKGNELPAALFITSEKQISSPPKPVTFTTPAAVTSSASQIFGTFDIPKYPGPSRDIARETIYVPPAFVIKQLNSNNNFILTPKVDRIFPNMTMIMDQSTGTESGLAKVEQIKMKFAQEGADIGFSFGISDTIPDILRLPKVPFDALALFLNIDFVDDGAEGKKDVNFTNPNSFESSPQFNILVSRSLNTTKLMDGCANISLLSLDVNAGNWQVLNKPVRDKAIDTLNECGYTIHTGHFSKFAVGGVKPPSEPPEE